VTENSIDASPREVILVSQDASPAWVEVRIGDALDETHELDEAGRVVRSLFRTPRQDGSVEIRYRRDDAGNVLGSTRFDRTGQVISD
jgi:hypothetical protein